MKKVIFPLLLLTLLISTYSCSTDFDMYADYEDMTVVYGMVDISDDTTWIKITKAYTGPGNALVLAQNPDSSNYPYKLDATIVGKKNGVTLDPLVLDTITIHNKDLADSIHPFYSPDQLMYYTTGDFDEEAEYTLNINKHDGLITASTGLVGNFGIIKPNSRFSFNKTSDGTIEWNAADNGIKNEVTLSFNYLELAPGESDTLHKSFSWYVGTVKAKTDEGTEILDVQYSGEYFFNLLENELEPIPNVERWADSVYITIAAGSQVLTTYLDINSGSSSLLEEVPVYSNIEGGTGIFASRNTVLKAVLLSTATERQIIEDYDLGFKFKQ